MCTRLYTHILIHSLSCAHVCIRIYLCILSSPPTLPLSVYTCVRARMYVSVRVYICVPVCVRMRVCL